MSQLCRYCCKSIFSILSRNIDSSLHREVGWFLAFQDAVDVGGGKPIQRGLINPEGDQSAFGDETAEVMRSNGAMIVPQDIKPSRPCAKISDKV